MLRRALTLLALSGCMPELEPGKPSDDSTPVVETAAPDDTTPPELCTWYVDADGDTWGVEPGALELPCAEGQPTGYVDRIGDCNDDSAEVNPDAVEICNGLDDNCDGATDGDDAEGRSTFYMDSDGDGFGDAASPVLACEAPPGAITDASDCDDGNAAVHPDATEVCNGLDDDCSGQADGPDAADATRWWPDQDQDGWGVDNGSLLACEAPGPTWADQTGDCDDDNSDAFPDQTGWFSRPRADGSFDYDCDGNDSIRYVSRVPCVYNPSFQTCTYHATWAVGTPAPACGVNGNLVTACSNACQPTTMLTTPQTCH